MVNWGKLTDKEYFSVLLSTDILIGVSGNSLDCMFFLVPKSVVVEIIPFDLAKLALALGLSSLVKSRLGNRVKV